MASYRFRFVGLACFCLCVLLLQGCNWPEFVDTITFQNKFRQPFTTLSPEDESVAQIDIATIIWRRDQPMLNEGMWAELDEQFIPLDLRKNLAQQGLRVGLMRSAVGSRLQSVLANPEYDKQAQLSSTDVIRTQMVVNDQFMETSQNSPVCTVEARRILSRHELEVTWPVGPRGGQARLLVPDAEADYSVKEVSDLELQYSMTLRKLPDGQTLLRIVPMVKCGLGKTATSNVFIDSLRNKNSINKLEQRYEKLAFEATLSQDQYLVVTATRPEGQLAKDAETWGDLAFVNYPMDQQTVLVFRGASVLGKATLQAPRKGNAWPLAWQTRELQPAPGVQADPK